jgi:hypothetical protein
MKSLDLKTRLAVLLLSTCCLLTGAYAQITPSADASTSSLAPTQNYGSNGYLYVHSATQATYIQFDLSAIPSGYTGSNIAKASLKLYLYSVAGGGTFNVDYVTSPWTEKTITFSDSPTLGGFIAVSENIAAANAKDYVIIDITPAVQAWLNGTESNNGIALVGNGTFNAAFESKENTVTSHPPELDIVFAGGGGITGITTASGSGLTGGGTSGTLNLSLINTCSIGQVLAWNGSGWACSTVSGGGGGITGSGTVNSLPLFNGVTSIGSSNVFQSSTNTNIGIGTTTPQAALDVNGSINLPNTTSSTVGVLSLGGVPFLSNYPGTFGAHPSQNTFVGASAGNMTTTGNGNSALGYSSLQSNSGNSNSAFGDSALTYNSTGQSNTGGGFNSLIQNTTGSFNTGLGAFAGETTDSSNLTTSNNTAVGSFAALSTGTLTNATAIGSNAVVGASNSLVLGSIAGQNGATSSVNVGIGTATPQSTLDVHGNTSVTGNLNVTGTVTCGSGCSGGGGSGVSSVTGTTGIISSPTTGAVTLSADRSVVAFQADVTAGITTAENYASANFLPLTAASSFATLGPNAFTGNQTITGNVGIGTTTPQATLDVNGTINVANGLSLGGTTFDSGSVASSNAFLGFAGSATNSGTSNTASGWQALSANTTGDGNVANGYDALQSNITGSFNTALGFSAGQTVNGSLIIANNDTFLGAGAKALNGGISNATAIGSNSVVGLSNAVVLGTIAGINNATANSNVGIGTFAPSATFDVEAPTGATPSVNFFGTSTTPGTFAVNGNTTLTGNLNVTGTVTCGSGCSGGGGGGGGTVTSVAAGAGLLASPSPITTSGTLSINPAVVPQLGTANNFVGNQSVTGNIIATGNISATGEISTNGLIFAGSMSTFGTMNAGTYGLGGTTVLAHAPSTGGSLLLGENTGNSTLLSSLDLSSTTAIGDNTLRFYTGGSYNTALGNSALYEATSGANNTGAGYEALFHNTSGSNNTAMGYNAGNPTGFQNTTGSNNTFLGANSSVGNQLALNYATAIGAGAVVGQNNAMVLGGPAGSAAAVNVGIGTSTPVATLDVEGTTPTVNFGSASNPATLTINGSLNVTGAVTCGSGCSGGGGGGVTNVVAGTDLTGGGSGPTVTLNLNTSATDLRYSQLGATNTFVVTQTINTSSGIGLTATTSTPSSSGVFGYNTATVGNGNGVYGLATAANGVGVLGANSAATGEAPGVLGESSSSGGTGVWGSGNFSGVAGYTSSPTGYGVFGSNTATTGGGNGVLGQTTTPTGTGVVGINNAATTGYGVYGSSANTGVYGTGNGSGVTGATSSPTGSGVVGVNSGGGYAGFFQGNAAVTGNLSIGGDVPMSSNPRMVFSGFLIGNLGNSPVGGYFVPDRNIVITRVTISENSAGQSCSTLAQVLLINYNAGGQFYALDLPNNDFAIDSGALSLPVAGSNRISIVANPASGCSLGGSSPSDVFVNVQYVMQ